MDREQAIIDVFIERDKLKKQYAILMDKYLDLEDSNDTLAEKYIDIDAACNALKAELLDDMEDGPVKQEAIEAIITANRAKCGSK